MSERGGLTVKKLIVLSVVLVCAFALSANAAVVYSQPLSALWALYSDTGFPHFAADDFVLNAHYDVTDVHWWGVYADTSPGDDPPADNFTVEFYLEDTSPGLPAYRSYSASAVSRTFVQAGGGMDIYFYSYDLPAPLSLSAGATYYLGIYNSTPLGEWAWCKGTDGTGNGSAWVRGSLGDPYHTFGDGDLAFELTVPDETIIPEPITSALFVGSVLLGLGRLRRRHA